MTSRLWLARRSHSGANHFFDPGAFPGTPNQHTNIHRPVFYNYTNVDVLTWSPGGGRAADGLPFAAAGTPAAARALAILEPPPGAFIERRARVAVEWEAVRQARL